MSVILPRKTKYAEKDQRKANQCNKFIGRGSVRSSTHAYAIAFGANANCGHYFPDDVVMLSVEGDRYGRKSIDSHELKLALVAGATIITDTYPDRQRPYNVGEREAVYYLLEHKYQERQPGIWTSRENNYPKEH